MWNLDKLQHIHRIGQFHFKAHCTCNISIPLRDQDLISSTILPKILFNSLYLREMGMHALWHQMPTDFEIFIDLKSINTMFPLIRSHTLVPSENEYEFVIALAGETLRFNASSW